MDVFYDIPCSLGLEIDIIDVIELKVTSRRSFITPATTSQDLPSRMSCYFRYL